MSSDLLQRIRAGRTDLVFEDPAADSETLRWCAYYGDVSGLRHLLARGLSLDALGEDRGLNAAAFHGHWQLCEYLLEHGADANRALRETGESPLHAALTHEDRARYDLVVKVLLAAGADPNASTLPGAPTGSLMRDARTRAETPLHRAAAFGTEDTIQLLLEAGAYREARDQHGDTPLAWASWHRRPVGVLRKLLYGEITIHPDYEPMRVSLLGKPKPV